MIFRLFLQIVLVVSVAEFAHAQDRPQPEISTGIAQQRVATGSEFMAVTANPHATQAAYDILKKGGSAVDAAIAAQLVLGLVEPQSSGLGGGAFALVYDAKEKRLRSYDARETAPNLAGSFLFFENGKPLPFKKAVIGGRSVGVPGVPMLLSDMHERHGKLTWMELFDASIALSEDGFTVSPRLAKMLAHSANDLRKDTVTAAHFMPNDQPLRAGDILKSPEYLKTLKDFSFSNSSSFYRGAIAQNIVSKVQSYADNPGLLANYDFEKYQVKERKPVCGPYRAYIVCSMGEPSSGGLTLLQILGMLEHFDISKKGADSWHVIAQASALAFADRGTYMADSDFVNTPSMALLDPSYLKSRAALINEEKPLETIGAGLPSEWNGELYEKGLDLEQPGTTHISIVDKEGNIVSLTSSIEGAFGSHLMTNGYLLNNQLTDFSFKPFDDQRKFVANMVEPGKRPRSSMSPTIVFDAKGDPVLVLGSAGGSRIINHVLQQIISVIDWEMPIDHAMGEEHVLARNETIELAEPRYQEQLVAKDNKVEIREINSGLTAIHINDNLIRGVADHRREGQALGE